MYHIRRFHRILIGLGVAGIAVSVAAISRAPAWNAQPGTSLELEPHSTLRFTVQEQAPIAVAALAPDTVALLPAGRSHIELRVGAQVRRVAAPRSEEIDALGPGRGRIWAASSHGVFHLSPGEASATHSAAPPPGGRVTALTESAGALWLLIERTYLWLTRTWLMWYDPATAGADVLAGNADSLYVGMDSYALHAHGDGVLIVARQEPFTISLIRADGRTAMVWHPLRSHAVARKLSGVSDVRSLAAVPLADGRLLQWFTSLRQEWRMAVVWSEQGAVQTVRQLDTPLGVTQSFGGGAWLVGAREAPGVREITIFRVQAGR